MSTRTHRPHGGKLVHALLLVGSSLAPFGASHSVRGYSRGAADAQPADSSVAMIAASGSWPRWRGPSGQGLAADSGYPDSWSDTQNVLWRARVPGRGHSSPIVWGDRIFLTTSYGDGRAAIVSFRRADGRQLWETGVPDRTPEHVHPKNSHASATPATDGTRVFASFGNKGVLAVDLDGRVLWHRSLGAIDNYHGAPTPNVILLESDGHSDILAGLDDLADVCDPGTRVVISGNENDDVPYRELMRRGINDYMVGPVATLDVVRAICGLYASSEAVTTGPTM